MFWGLMDSEDPMGVHAANIFQQWVTVGCCHAKWPHSVLCKTRIWIYFKNLQNTSVCMINKARGLQHIVFSVGRCTVQSARILATPSILDSRLPLQHLRLFDHQSTVSVPLLSGHSSLHELKQGLPGFRGNHFQHLQIFTAPGFKTSFSLLASFEFERLCQCEKIRRVWEVLAPAGASFYSQPIHRPVPCCKK